MKGKKLNVKIDKPTSEPFQLARDFQDYDKKNVSLSPAEFSMFEKRRNT